MVKQMIKVKISKNCQSWGQCVFDAPNIFQLEDSERKTWSYDADDSELDNILTAQSHCPNRAIKIERF